MAAASTDKFTLVGNPGTATTLSAPGHSIAGTTFNVISTSNWPTTTGVIFAVDTFTTQIVNGISTAVRTPGSYTEWEGVVASSTQITGGVLRYGTDQNYSAGANTRVYIPVASQWVAQLISGLLVAHNQDGTLAANAITSAAQITDGIIGDAEMATAVKPVTNQNETTFDHVRSGCVWTADAAGSTRLATMSSGVVQIAGKRLTVAGVTSRTFTASKDVYVDFSDNGDGTALITYTDGTTNAASGALAAGSLRNAIVVVGASSIATAASINQGQEDRVLPIASSVPYAVTDSLGNLICPRDPNRRVLGYKQVLGSIGSITSATGQLATSLTVPVIVPSSRKVIINVYFPDSTNTASALNQIQIWDGTVGSGTMLNVGNAKNRTAGDSTGFMQTSIETTPNATSKTYNVGVSVSSGTGSFSAGTTFPAYIKVELT